LQNNQQEIDNLDIQLLYNL